jgi:hypothetical protein
MTLLVKVFYVFFGVGFVDTALYFIFLRKLFNLLKNKYPEKYKELGEPSLWWNNSPRNGVRTLRFISSKDPLFESDKELLRTKNLASIFLYIDLVIFFVLFLLFFLFFVIGYQT